MSASQRIAVGTAALLGVAVATMITRCLRASTIVLALLAASASMSTSNAQPRGAVTTAGGAWPAYGGDLGHTRYAPLEQIDASNFGSLEIAWRFSVANLGPTPEMRLQSTPLVVDGVLYTTGGTRRAVTALNAATGEQLWVHSLDEGARGAEAPRQGSGRGLAFWQRGNDKRVVYVTPGYQLVALNAATGRPVEAFGERGIVDLKASLDQGDDWDGTRSAPTRRPRLPATSYWCPLRIRRWRRRTRPRTLPAISAHSTS